MIRAQQATCYLIDIEGVLVRDKRYVPIAGAVAWFNNLAQQGIKTCLVSNNTTHWPHELIDDLVKAGFMVTPSQLVSALTIGMELLCTWGKKKILWLGAPRLRDYWQEHGFELVGEETCQAVVLGLNPELQIADLQRALPSLLDAGAELVALHRNIFYLDSAGQRRFGPGAWCAALETAAANKPAICVGKPAERIYREALKRVGASADKVLFVSDDPVADLITAKRLGMQTAMVLSGKHADCGVLGSMDQQDWPDIICTSVAELGW
jgi:HAD superfamily hydrolase (TIGR01450 family)